MQLTRLVQPDGIAVYLCPALVVSIWQSPLESIGGDGIGVHSVVAWTLPSERDDRTHTGRLTIVRGTPDEVAKVLGLAGKQ